VKAGRRAAAKRLTGAGLSVSADGRWLLYAQRDGQAGSDLMLAENFRQAAGKTRLNRV
jgi:hypothetical protein